jgi:hypothetical protein
MTAYQRAAGKDQLKALYRQSILKQPGILLCVFYHPKPIIITVIVYVSEMWTISPVYKIKYTPLLDFS